MPLYEAETFMLKLQQMEFNKSVKLTVFAVSLIPARKITCPAPRELARLILI